MGDESVHACLTIPPFEPVAHLMKLILGRLRSRTGKDNSYVLPTKHRPASLCGVFYRYRDQHQPAIPRAEETSTKSKVPDPTSITGKFWTSELINIKRETLRSRRPHEHATDLSFARSEAIS